MNLRQIKMQAGMALIIPALILLFAGTAFCQPDTLWTSGISNAGPYLQVIRTGDGGYAVGTHGWSGDEERGDADFQLMKLDSLGDLEWRQFYPGIYNNGHGADYGFTVCQTPDGGYILGGRRHGCVLIRTDDVGDTLWMRYYRSDDGFPSPMNGAMKCCITPDRNIVFNSRQMVVKVDDENGDLIWRQEYEDAFDLNEILCIEEDGFLIGGRTRSFGAGLYDVYVAKLDSEGNVEWQEAYGTEDGEYCKNLIPTTDNGYFIIGGSRYDPGNNNYHPYLLRISGDGDLIWHRIYDDIRGVALEDVVETSDGGFAVVGHTNWYLLFRFDYSGEMLWRTHFNRYGERIISGEAYSIHLMHDEGYLLGGFSDLGCWLIRTEPDPVDLQFELEIDEEEYDFGEVAVDNVVDTVGVWEFELRNIGRRYVVIDSLWFEGDTSAFAGPINLPYRINPEDTSFVPVFFQPSADTTYNTTLILPYGDEQTLEITLSGRGVTNSVLEEPNILREFVLHEAYPNPFNSTTLIHYSLDRPGITSLNIFDIAGREVAVLRDGYMKSGDYSTLWNGEDMPSGVYFCRLVSSGRGQVVKVVLMR